MKLSEALLEEYAKKILGFAYEKVGNSYEAEELAQEIMLQLLNCINKQVEVEHLSSFIYTVCCYTWSKYLRKNKKHWDYADLEEAGHVADSTDVEGEVIDKILYGKLRKMISSLARKQREIIVMHYYDDKTTAEISKILDMNESTVRWYLGNIRDTLKEKLNMSENLDFRPVSLCIGIDGCIENDVNFNSLESDLLVQNIALACYGEPLTITEISEKLNVAAAYLEKHLEHMVYMDYLKVQGKKYQTNFFISNKEIDLAIVKYAYENAKPYADKLYDAVMARKEDLLAIDFFGKENVKEDYFMWYVLLKVAQEKNYEQMQKEWDRCKLMRPIRKDGSEFWIIACGRYTDNPDHKGLSDYLNYRHCSGYKININDNIGATYQADTYFCMQTGSRDFTDEHKHLKAIQIAKAIMKSEKEGYELSEIEKLYVTEFVESGYITIKDGKPILNVPVFTWEQFEQLNKIVNEIKESLGDDFIKEYLAEYGRMMDNVIPQFLDKNIRNYHKYAIMGGFHIFAHLIKEAKEGGKCSLEIPTAEEGRHAMTWIVVK